MYRSHSSNSSNSNLLLKKMENFDINHHETVRHSFSCHMTKWYKELDSGSRCRVCWLRSYQCYCQVLNRRKADYQQYLEEAKLKYKIMMYYHYIEIGRSPNTAHVFEALCPQVCDKVLFGDSEQEIKLMETMLQDFKSGENSYCILYPTSTAVTIGEWMESRQTTNPGKPVTMIALDGTYSQALRQFKHLKKCAVMYGFELPAVKLDLGEKGCESAISGMM